MRLIKKTDKSGYRRLYYVKDNDPNTAKGIEVTLPDLNELDWEDIIRDIHNKLVDSGLVKLQDIQKSNSGLNSIIISTLKRRIVNLYRSIEND